MGEKLEARQNSTTLEVVLNDHMAALMEALVSGDTLQLED